MNGVLPQSRTSPLQAELVPPGVSKEQLQRPTHWVSSQYFDCCPEAVVLISAETMCVLTSNSTFQESIAPMSSTADSHILDVLCDGVDGLRMEQVLQTILSDAAVPEGTSCIVNGCDIVANGKVRRSATYDWAVKRQGEVVILSGREVPRASADPTHSVVVPHWLGAPIGGLTVVADAEAKEGTAASLVESIPIANATSQPNSSLEKKVSDLMEPNCSREVAVRRMEEMRQFAEVKAYGELLQQMEVLMQKIFHEIRTPCHALQMITKTVLETMPGNDEIKGQLETAWAQSVHICQLADDVKCVISLQSGQLSKPQPSWFHLRSLLVEKQRFIQSLFTTNLVLKICCDSIPEDLWVYADPSLLSVVLRQLLTNAVRYTEVGEVTLEVHRENHGTDHITFCVINEGPAVPPSLLQDIQRSWLSTTGWLDRLCARILSDTSDGFGLGLPIASTYVKAMGGQLEVSSHASVNTFSFGINVESRTGFEGSPTDGFGHLQPSTSQFSLTPTRFSLAVSGSSSINLASIMPSHSGSSEVDKLCPTPKDSEGRSSPDPAHGRGKKPKCGRFQWKCLVPWSRSAREAASDHQASTTTFCPDNTQPTSMAASRPPRVLVVEDNLVCQKVVCRCLERHGMPHALADNGKVACDLVAEDPTSFDVVLMDIRMPVMDGVTATRILRKELGAKMPIIVFSAELREHTWEEASQAGATDILPKPATPQMVVEMIRRHSHRARP